MCVCVYKSEESIEVVALIGCFGHDGVGAHDELCV